MGRCESGKIKYDKRGALTLKNSIMEKQHIEMKEYQCKICNYWHLTTVGEKSKPFVCRMFKLDK